MSQHDYNIANQTFPATRTDVNNVLSAILSMNSGASAPTTTSAGMLWYDTSAGVIKQRNSADSGWTTIWDEELSTMQTDDAANQTVMEAATSTSAFCTPQNVKHHPAHGKNVVRFNGTGTPAADSSFQFTSIVDNGTGDYTINWADSFSANANNQSLATAGTNVDFVASVTSALTGTTRVQTHAAGTQTDADYVTVLALGDK